MSSMSWAYTELIIKIKAQSKAGEKMKTDVHFFKLVSFVFALLFVIAGCGGGGGDTGALPGGGSTPRETTGAEDTIIADAGDIIGVRVGATVSLDGSASSTTLTGPLTYAWSFTSIPDGSAAVLQNELSATPSFLADLTGTYMAQLVVSADGKSSQRAIASVEISSGGNFTGKRVHLNYPAICSECHDGRFLDPSPPYDTVPAKSPDHMAASNSCEACHTTFGFELIRFVDHDEVFGDCSGCHNGTIAIGKSDFHVETNAECDQCHTTSSFFELGIDGSYDHTGVTSGCIACHNGTTAIGRDVGHDDIFTGSTDNCNFCHTTETFIPAFVDHSTITSNCASCHNGTDAVGQTVGHPDMAVDCSVCHSTRQFSLGGVFNHRVDTGAQSCAGCHTDNNSINARGKSALASHVITTDDCGVCHGVGGGSFANGIFEHYIAGTSNPRVEIVDNCNACHTNVTDGGTGDIGDGSGPLKSANHMPTEADCSLCHTKGTFYTGTFDHAPIVVDPVTCDSCHDGAISVGKGIYHIPTASDCRTCHTTTTFTGTVFDHVGIDTTNCQLCHDGNVAPGKKINHIPTSDDCSICHVGTTSGDFATSSFLANTHPGLTNGCASCHTSAILPLASKSSSHIPTNQECNVCHTQTVFKPSTFIHTGINNNCVLCHDGKYVTSGARRKTINHVITLADCSVCHNINNFAGAFVDHTSPTVTAVRCDSCHDNVIEIGKNASHIQTAQDCRVCHVPGTFIPAIFEHVGIVDNCASCHDGTSARGKPTLHVPTNQDCSFCHTTGGFMPATFDHVGIVDNCVSCHDGLLAPGKTTNHILTNDDCGLCHTTRGFVPSTFDHSTITNNTRCDTCHGVTATPKNTGHLATNLDCRSCHTTATFVGGTWVHDGTTVGTCDTCHVVNGGATPKPTGHLATTLQCDSCHTTNGWAPTNFTHDPQGNYPGDHRVNFGCNACHGNSITATIPYPSIQYAPFCAGCHAGDFSPEGDHNGGRNGTIEQNKDCSGGGRGCHRVNDGGF